MDNTPNFQIFLTESLLQLKKHCKRRNSDISNEIEKCLTSVKMAKSHQTYLTIEIFKPFKLACESRNLELMLSALDSSQKLVATSLEARPLESPSYVHEGESEKCIQAVMKTVCDCGLHPNEQVGLKVIQSILTIISSSYDIHSEHLFYAIRTCFHIYLTSKSALNRTSSRATLAQIVHVIFDRSKKFTALFEKLVKENCNDQKGVDNIFDKILVINFEEIKIDSKNIKLLMTDQTKEGPKICKEIILHTIYDKVLKQSPGKYGFCIVCRKPSFHFCLQTQDSVCSMECKIENLSALASSEKSDPKKRNFLSIVLLTVLYQVDTLIVFKSLNRLAAKALDTALVKKIGDNERDKPIELLSKELALDLILHIFKSSSDSIKKSKQFLELVKTDLVGMLLHNIFEKVSNVSATSLAIFLELLSSFKTHLKTEIGVFLECIFCKIIESKNSTYKQKLICVMVFAKICSCSQTLVDIFLNYDCNSDTFHIFASMVGLLEKMTQNPLVANDWITKHEEIQLKLMSLQSFKMLFQSLLFWAERAIEIRQKNEEAEPKSIKKDGDATDITTSEGFCQKYSENQERKNILEKAIAKFNQSPTTAISMLKSVEIIDANSPGSVARFLFKTEKLEKRAIGEYLSNPDHDAVLESYVFLFDFSKLYLDEAVRLFLSRFVLSGESQKIDRIMGKFAIKYCFDNPAAFKHSDTAHILSFSIIMLNTDHHSSSISKKMSLRDFVKNNKSVAVDEDASFEECLRGIYGRISAAEIKMDQRKENKAKKLTPKIREELFSEEQKKMKNLAEKFVTTEEHEERFINTSNDNLDIIYRMFESVWSSTLASMSVLLESSDNAKIISVCLETYKYAIKLATVFEMDIIKEAYINTLASLTLLGTDKEMRPKNIKAIQTILEVAERDGKCLGNAWGIVLQCISRVEHLHLVGTGNLPDSRHFCPEDSHRRLVRHVFSTHFGAAYSESWDDEWWLSEGESRNSKAVAYLIEQEIIEKIFSNSQYLNDKKIEIFYHHLTKVVTQELLNANEPRVFSVDKITETTIYNLHRPLKVWERIWSLHFKELFAKASEIGNLNIAKYAINAYRVVITRLLSVERLHSDESFQRELFAPIIAIFWRSKAHEIREIALQCVFKVVQSVSSNLSSAWERIFELATIGVSDTRETIATASLNLVKLAELKILAEKTRFPRAIMAMISFIGVAMNSYFEQIYSKAVEFNFHLLVTVLAENKGLILKPKMWKNCFGEKSENSENIEKPGETSRKAEMIDLFLFGICNALSFTFDSDADMATKLICLEYLKDLLSLKIPKPVWAHLFENVLLPPIRTQSAAEICKRLYPANFAPSLGDAFVCLDAEGVTTEKAVWDEPLRLSGEESDSAESSENSGAAARASGVFERYFEILTVFIVGNDLGQQALAFMECVVSFAGNPDHPENLSIAVTTLRKLVTETKTIDFDAVCKAVHTLTTLITAQNTPDEATPDASLWGRNASEVVRKLEMVRALKPVVERLRALAAESKDEAKVARLKGAAEAAVVFIRTAQTAFKEKAVSVERTIEKILATALNEQTALVSTFFNERNGAEKVSQ